MTTPVMVIREELLAVTTPVGISATWLLVQLTFAPTTGKARLKSGSGGNLGSAFVDLEHGNKTLEVMVVLVTQ